MALRVTRTWFSQLRHLGRRLLRRQPMDRDLDEEVQSYFDIQIERGIAHGLSPAEARRAAQPAFERPDQVKQLVREARVAAFLDTTWQDVRAAWRTLRGSPGFTTFAVLTIALCLGANAAIFTLVDGVLLKGIDYPNPERIVRLWEKPPGGRRNAISSANYLDWAAQSTSFEAIAAQSGATMSFSGGGEPRSVRVGQVSAGFFDVFGIRPALGRTFTRGEDQSGQSRVAVLSHRLWRTLFAEDASLVGRNIRLDGDAYTVIGVLPRDSEFDRRFQDLWVPLVFSAEVARDYHHLTAMARLKPDVTLDQARGELDAIAGRIAAAYPAIKQGWSVTIERHIDLIVGPQTRLALNVLMSAVAVVLLIGCANLANLLLARATLRSREMAVRLALGAGRGRVVRMLLTESLMLSLTGALLGAAIGYGLLRGIQSLMPPFSLPAEARVAMDGRVLLFMAGLVVLTGAAFGLAPALHASRREAAGALKESGRSSSASRGLLRARQLFVTLQVAITFVLLVGGGLLLRSLNRILAVQTNFDPQGLIAGQLPIAWESQRDAGSLRGYVDRLLAEVRAQPDVREAAVTTGVPLRGWGDGMPMYLATNRNRRLNTGFKIVSPAYFQALGLKPVAGRLLDARDTSGSAPVVVVNQSFVRLYFEGQNPLGQHILVRRIHPSRRGLLEQVAWEIIGVVPDERARGLEAPTDVGAYASFAQSPVVGLGLVVKGRGDGSALIPLVQQAIWQVNASQVLDRPMTVQQIKADTTMLRRLTAVLLAGFAVLALLLACSGIYAVLSFVTARRTQELGIRAALGASRGNLIALVLRGGSVPVLLGLAVGLAGAFGLTGVIQSLLFATDPLDPGTLVAAGALLLSVATAACFVPAWRAAGAAPMTALRLD